MGLRTVIGVKGWLILLACLLPLATSVEGATEAAVETTYLKLMRMAELGDAQAQNLVGVMLLYGEGVDRDYERSHAWFHESAEQGHFVAARNLGIFHSGILPGLPEIFVDTQESNLWFSLAAASLANPERAELTGDVYELILQEKMTPQAQDETDYQFGERIYLGLCAGCHGFNGWGVHEGVPSFAQHDRLNKDDSELVRSVLYGLGNMPAWEDSFSVWESYKVVAYIRERFILRGDTIPPRPGVATVDNPGELQKGERAYFTFCAGCHGFSGIAYYRNSPSFALGDRMDKPDWELIRSISNGKGQMPGWEGKLEDSTLESLMKYIRTLKPKFDSGLVNHLRESPAYYFRFRPRGEEGSGEDWGWMRR
ncbi:c-type cytochrome [Aestuariirhabdus litorea]|nr:c-type cytochrome [Aestuariirhabdus litorea]